MVRRTRSAESALEQDNRREIGSLKDAISELAMSVVVNTEATKGLKEVVEKEFNRHSEDRRGPEGRMSVIEARVDNVDIAMAARATIDERVGRIGLATEKLSDRTSAIEKRLDISDGWSSGAKWMIGIALGISVPCAGWVLVSILSKLFGM